MMKRSLSGLILILFLSLVATAQESGSSSPPSTPPSSGGSSGNNQNNNSGGGQRGGGQASASAQAAQQKLNMAGRAMELEMLSRSLNDPFTIVRPDVDKLYRKTNKKDLAKLSLDSSDANNSLNFLKEKNTGLIKLLPDAGCDKDSKVVVVTEQCLKYDFPGAGSAYSFRTADYRIRQLSDMILDKDIFYSDSVWTLGIFATVGDVPLEQLDLNSPALKYLNEFQPATEQEKAVAIQQELTKGIKANGFVYSYAVNAKENTTYLLRSVAYNGKFYREMKGVIYDELSFDKRKDVIVGFRVIRKDADGAVTILWKELSRKDAPKLALKKERK